MNIDIMSRFVQAVNRTKIDISATFVRVETSRL
jgi:hypothetical protein